MMDKLLETFASVLRLHPTSLTDDSSSENTQNWDSLSAARLVTAIEETFNVELTTSEIMLMRSIGTTREMLRRKGVNV